MKKHLARLLALALTAALALTPAAALELVRRTLYDTAG